MKMATPGMGWQQPQHSYGGGSAPGPGKLGSGSAQPGVGAEHSPDLHFKMSKKIAQLTKVRERPPARVLSRRFSLVVLLLVASCHGVGREVAGGGRLSSG